MNDARDPFNIGTNAKGEISLPIGSPGPQNVRFLPNKYVDCRYARESVRGLWVKLPLAEIITKGIVTGNVCGKQHADPTPGVLAVYVRKRTLMEWWRL
ncbi:MAG TPA: hypothetical protein VFR08_16070 [Candidatus Angelobacter sp.]|nr:hypothetical protein [Candidatus Angelobacter sp.]